MASATAVTCKKLDSKYLSYLSFCIILNGFRLMGQLILRIGHLVLSRKDFTLLLFPILQSNLVF